MKMILPGVALCWLGVLGGAAGAGEVRIEANGKFFELKVSVKNGPFEPKNSLENPSGAYVYPFDDKLFEGSAYVGRIFVLDWKPLEADKPAAGVAEYSLEIPVTLRSWKANEIILIRAWSFDGTGENKLSEYERLSSPELQWRKLMASLQQADHYARRVRPTAGQTRRAYTTALNGLVEISKSVDWLSAPLGSEKWIREAFEDEDKAGSLLEQLRKVDDAIIVRDVRTLEQKLIGRNCDFVRNSVAYLVQKRDENKAAYRLDSPLYPEVDALKQRVEKAACSTADNAPRSLSVKGRGTVPNS